MHDHDYMALHFLACTQARDFKLDDPSAPSDLIADKLHPSLFSDALAQYPEYGSKELSDAIYDGIRDGIYDALRDGYGAVFFD